MDILNDFSKPECENLYLQLCKMTWRYYTATHIPTEILTLNNESSQQLLTHSRVLRLTWASLFQLWWIFKGEGTESKKTTRFFTQNWNISVSTQKQHHRSLLHLLWIQYAVQCEMWEQGLAGSKGVKVTITSLIIDNSV